MQIERAIYLNNIYEGIYSLVKINDSYFWTLKDAFKAGDKYIRLDVEWRQGMSTSHDLIEPFQFSGNFIYCEGDLGDH